MKIGSSADPCGQQPVSRSLRQSRYFRHTKTRALMHMLASLLRLSLSFLLFAGGAWPSNVGVRSECDAFASP